MHALKNVTGVFEAGQFVCIVGANGSGKSTFARLLNGLLLPTTGTVLIEGRPTHDAAALWAIRQRIGVVFQNPDNQFVGATVEEDIAFGPQNFGVPGEQIDARIDEALRTVQIDDLRQTPPHLLSGGQKQLVAIAGVLAQHPSCLVLDEATSMLDPRARQRMMQTIEHLVSARGVTVIHITHHMDEALAADRIVGLEEGRLVFDGRPDELLTQAPLIERLGLRLPSVARIRHELARLGVDVGDVGDDVDELVERLCQLR